MKHTKKLLASAATISSASAAVVQITQTGNFIQMNNLSSFDSDLTGDGTGDISAFNFNGPDSFGFVTQSFGLESFVIGSFLSYNIAFAVQTNSFRGLVFYENLDTQANRFYSGNYSWIFELTDSRVNGGSPTEAVAELQFISGVDFSDHVLQINRVIFDDEQTSLSSSVNVGSGLVSGTYAEFSPTNIPEPSSLGLLALGAAGVLVRRKRVA